MHGPLLWKTTEIFFRQKSSFATHRTAKGLVAGTKCSSAVWFGRWKSNVGGQGLYLTLSGPRLDVSGGVRQWKFHPRSVFNSPPPDLFIWTKSIFRQCVVLTQTPALSKLWATTATCGHQTPSTHPPPPAAPAVLPKTSCLLAWTSMLSHRSYEPAERQDPLLRSSSQRSPRVTKLWSGNKPYSCFFVTFWLNFSGLFCTTIWIFGGAKYL